MWSSIDYLKELCAIIIIAIITEMSTRNIPEGKGLKVPEVDNLTAIWQPIA
jgi:hypothetical protein